VAKLKTADQKEEVQDEENEDEQASDSVPSCLAFLLGPRLSSIAAGRLFSKSAVSFVLRVGSLGMGFLTSIILARLLGADGYGAYKFVLSWCQFLVIFAALGFDQLLIREVAAYVTDEKWRELRGILLFANGTALITSCLIAGGVFAVTQALYADGRVLQIVFGIGMILVPLRSLTRLRQASMQGFDYPVLGQTPESALRPILFLVVIAAIYFFGTGAISASHAMAWQVGVSGIAFLVGTVLVFWKMPACIRTVRSSFDAQTWIYGAIPMAAIGAMYVLNKYADILILGAMVESANVGVYAAGSQGASVVRFVLVAANMVIAPEFSRLYAENDVRGLQSLAQNSAAAIFAASFLIAVGLIILGPYFLLLYGSEFSAGYAPLVILSVGNLASAGAGSVGFLLMMTGYERIAAVNVGSTAVLNIILNVLLIPVFGLVGAATATMVSTVFVNVLQGVYCYKKLRVFPSVLGYLITIKGSD
jgi:O-antigen/teichoic acid export membrane protein